MKLIDLFCGAGGFSLGAHFAGFHTALAVDKDRVLTSRFATNFPNAKLLIADLQTTSGATLLVEAGITAGEDFGIIGGPPCQGFSLMGKRDVADPRNSLLQHFFRLVGETKPKFFIMENVPGLLLKSARGLLDEAIGTLQGYEVLGPITINANSYGAATNRERVIVIGFKGTNPITESLLRASEVSYRPTVGDAIRDIPGPTKAGTASYEKSVKLSAYAISARTRARIAWQSQKTKQETSVKVTGLMPTIHRSDVVARFDEVLQGKSDPVSRFPRLSWDLPAPTLRAGTGVDHGSFQSVRPIHPQLPRVITVREAARLQGFPDWFQFHKTKWHSFRMIGNSVSPLMAEVLLLTIAANLARGKAARKRQSPALALFSS